MTPHGAMMAWGAAATTAREVLASFHAAEEAYDTAGRACCSYSGHSGVVEAGLLKAQRAAGTAEMRAYAAYYGAREVAVSARAAVCAAYTHAGFPQAVRALDTIARDELDWSPGLEDAMTALLSAPVRA